MKNTLILFIASLLVLSLQAQKTEDPYLVRMRNGAIVPATNMDPVAWPQFFRAQKPINGKVACLLQFDATPTAAQWKQLETAGISMGEYVDGRAYRVVLSSDPGWAILKQSGVRSAFVLSSVDKLSPDLYKGRFPAWAVRVPGQVDVWVQIGQLVSETRCLELFTAAGFTVRNTRFIKERWVELSVENDRLMALASLPYVDYVQAAPSPDQAINFNSRAGSRANLANAPLSQGGRGLMGEGLVIGVGDNGDPLTHVDFTGRVISRFAYPTGAHGVHVAGTVGGGGILSDTLAGYAPRARIVSQIFNRIFDFSPQYVRDEGMVLTNNSYGAIVNECDYNGLYDLYSRAWDQQAFTLPELLHVYAAGNSGGLNCPPYATGFKTVLGSYQSAKNVLTVGATQFNGLIAGFSSRGPVIDGRIKPEITAQGAQVVSTGFGGYYTNNGTSMSSPAATGGAALVIQRFRQLNNGANPANALVKNLLCNGATDKGNEGPDYTYGFGWMNVDRSLNILENNRYGSGSMIHGGFALRTIQVPAGQRLLKVMLNWNDPAASMVSYRTLVNDLDLELVTPTGSVLLPRVLDTVAARVNQVAGVGVDRINNIEQITLYDPPAGTYTIRVRGTSVNTLTQAYFISWDVLSPEAKLTFPVGGESFRPGQAINIQWDAFSNAGTFGLEYSIDNGTTWTSIVSGLASSVGQHSWVTPNITSDQVRVRLTNTATNTVQTSQSFLLLGLPVASLAPVQCETYISMNWTVVPGATDYEVMRLIGTEMQSVAIVPSTTTNYVFSGLSRDTVYWVGVRPRLNGKPGRRSTAIARQPSSGTCIGTISDNDFRMDALLGPTSSGRLNTSVVLSATQIISARIRNLDDVSYTGPVTFSYQVNTSAPVVENINLTNLAAGATYVHVFALPADLSAAGTYTIRVSVDRPGDPVATNNMVTQRVRQLTNAPLLLTSGWIDNFDALPRQELVQAQMGLEGSDRYDFSFMNSQGRLQTFINSGMAFSGERALTMDMRVPTAGGNTNFLIGTYNLSNYTTSDEIRLDFRFKQHGQLNNANNRVWIRGNDAAPWIQAYDLFANQATLGVYQRASGIELSDLLASNGQTFSSSFQIRWGQWGQYPATDDLGGAGYSIDDVQLYTVGDDIQLIRIDEPIAQPCVNGQSAAVKVTLRNTVGQSRSNVLIRMQLNGGAIITESIPVIAGNTTIQYTFSQPLTLSLSGPNALRVWSDLTGDVYRTNDTLQTVIRVLPVVTSYPYVQDFEASSDWYPDGSNASWELGVPDSYRIKGTGSGVRSWKTRLKGQYNDAEFSYLYSPCFNLSGLTAPMLSFLVALDLEDCGGTFCDGAYMEYSADGVTWTRLGAVGQGVNWYNRNYAGNPVWSTQSYSRWHVATIALPTGIPNMRLRFVMRSDISVGRDGIAVDDVHIYDNGLPIYVGPTLNTPVNLNYTSTDSWQPVTANNQLVAALQTTGQSGSVDVQAFLHSGPDRFTNGQYYLDRNWVLRGSALSDTARLRLYFLDRESDSLVFSTGCTSCERVRSVAELGLTTYQDASGGSQNLLLSDNGLGAWSYRARDQVRRVPYLNGYYMELSVRDWSEYWANTGWKDRVHGLPVDIQSYQAARLGPFSARLTWTTAYEYDVSAHEIQVAKGNEAWQQQQFVTVATLSSGGNSSQSRSYSFDDLSAGKSDVWYYRVKITHRDGWYVFTPAQPVVYDAKQVVRFYPNPSSGLFKGVFQANVGEVLRIRVYDAGGRLVKEEQQAGGGFLQTFWLDLSSPSIASGIYSVQITLRDQVSTLRVIKQ